MGTDIEKWDFWEVFQIKGQCNFSIAPVIYHFLILYISFANLKNFGFLRFHQDNRNVNFSEFV